MNLSSCDNALWFGILSMRGARLTLRSCEPKQLPWSNPASSPKRNSPDSGEPGFSFALRNAAYARQRVASHSKPYPVPMNAFAATLIGVQVRG
jgi:hypothetical protein